MDYQSQYFPLDMSTCRCALSIGDPDNLKRHLKSHSGENLWNHLKTYLAQKLPGPDNHPASGRGAIWAPRRLRPRGPDRHPVSAKRQSGPRRLGPQSSGARSFSNLEHLLHHTRPKQALAQPHIFKQPFCWVSGDVCWCRFVSVSICCCPEMTGGGF